MRSTSGKRGTSPCSTAHQLSARSITFCSGEVATTRHGPVVTGQPCSRSKWLKLAQSWPSKMCCGTTYTPMSNL